MHEFSSADAEGPALTFAELADALFRTNSAVVLPEGEVPADDPDSHEALRSFGVFATALRFNHENAGRKLLVAGHTDTTASVDFNQKLSEERAGTGLALLEVEKKVLKPVMVGDTIHGEIEILAVKPTTKGNRAVVTSMNDVVNQHGEKVISYKAVRMMAGREA